MKIRCARDCKQHLNDIALESSNLTESDHIDSMIQSEKATKSDGYLNCIADLKLKKGCQITRSK